jgi:DNA topoisomerase-2
MVEHQHPLNPNRYTIRELPVREWTEHYKKFLTHLEDSNQIKTFYEDHTETTVCFVVDALGPIADPISFFRLTKNHTTSLNSIVRCDNHLEVRSFASVREIFLTYFAFRLRMYELRRQHQVQMCKLDIPLKATKVRFIQLILEGTLRLGQKRSIMKEEMTRLDLSEIYHSTLLDMSVSSFTTERMEVLQQELQASQDRLVLFQKIKPEELWLQDLQELESSWT